MYIYIYVYICSAFKFQATAQQKRQELDQYLAAKTKPDLDHVQVSVLKTFDARVPDEMRRASLNNRAAASSFNRALGKEIIEGLQVFVRESLRL